MSTTLVFGFALMLEQFKYGLNHSHLSEDPAVPGPSVSQTEPPSLPHSVSTKSQTGLRFRSKVEDRVPHGSGFTHDVYVSLDRYSVGGVPVWSGVSVFSAQTGNELLIILKVGMRRIQITLQILRRNISLFISLVVTVPLELVGRKTVPWVNTTRVLSRPCVKLCH